MKRLLFFPVILLLCTNVWAQEDCPQVNTLDNNLTILFAQNATNFQSNDVILKTNAVTIDGVSYDALFTVLRKRLAGGGTAQLAATNGSPHFKLSGTHAENNPYIAYNMKFVESGSATSTNLSGNPVVLNNIKMYLPDIDGTIDNNRWYVDIAGYRVTGGTAPIVTTGTGLSQQGFYNNTSTGALQSISETIGFTKYRPNVPTSDYTDNYLTLKSTSNPSATTYAVDFNFSQFPATGIDLMFGVTSDPNQAVAGVTQGTASRTFFHVFTVENCPEGTSLPVTFGNVNAIVRNNELSINWKTLNETNNDHFLVEISKDGKQFSKLTEVKSKSINGSSNSGLEYNYTTNWGAISFALAFPAFLTLGLFGYSKKRKIISITIAALMIILLYSCSKNEASIIDQEGKKAFVRIGQVDKDGSIQYSKTVQVIIE